MNWQSYLVQPDATLLKTIEIIDASRLQIALVVDENMRLLGTVTDGDVRRGILSGISLTSSVSKVMNPNPIVCHENDGIDSIFARMREAGIRHIPKVNHDRVIVGMHLLDEFGQNFGSPKENTVVIMAGGMGKRLWPLTKDTPKPLLEVGDKPVLDTIVTYLQNYGFSKFYFAVNYRSEQIVSYFKDGKDRGVDIKYLHEKHALGTAGSLSLLPKDIKGPVIVLNGDLLTKLNFHQLLLFHESHGAFATIGVKEHEVEIPYGVVTLEKESVVRIVEKPRHKVFANAGIYVLEPEAIAMIAEDQALDMPVFFEKCITDGKKVVGFPVLEYWLDIGRMDDFKRAQSEFLKFFSSEDSKSGEK